MVNKKVLAVLAVLAISSLACLAQATPVYTPWPTFTPAEPTITETQPAPMAIVATRTSAKKTFIVSATWLWIRNANDDKKGFLHYGDIVECIPSKSGWCMIGQGLRVWSGCLEPNPDNLGCEAK